MPHAAARTLGALILGAALALPAAAQSPGPPTTAPTAGTKVKEGAPKIDTPAVASPPTPTQGSTAVPGWNNPPKSWENASEKPQYASIPGRETNTLIQAMGREWREFHNGPLKNYGGWMLAGVLAAIALFYLIRGPMKLHGKPTGRLIERFNAVERAAHWTTAISFVLLALTGLIILFGKNVILGWLGYSGLSWLVITSKNLHNFVGPLFIFSIVVMFLLYVKDNFPRAYDLDWLKKLGGMFGGAEVPSGKFNAGEKLWFWGGLVFLGLVVSVTGLILDFPNWNQGREAMQVSNVVHAIAALFFMAALDGSHVPGHHRHARRVRRDAPRIRGRAMGEGAPPALVRGSEGGPPPRAFRGYRTAAGPGRRLMKKILTIAGCAIVLAVGSAAAWAKIPPPPPPADPQKAAAAAEAKKEKDKADAEKAKADQTAAEDKAVKNFQDNMRKKGKPVPKPTPVVAASAPTTGGKPAPEGNTKTAEDAAKAGAKK